MLAHKGPVYMRIGNAPIPVLFGDEPFEIGKGRIIRDGNGVTIISTGSATANVIAAVNTLVDEGADPLVIGMPTIDPIDEKIIAYAAEKTKRIVTVEEHYVPGGLGTIVSEVCSKTVPVPIKMLGIPKTYASSGPYDALISYYGLDTDGIIKSVLDFVKEEGDT